MSLVTDGETEAEGEGASSQEYDQLWSCTSGPGPTADNCPDRSWPHCAIPGSSWAWVEAEVVSRGPALMAEPPEAAAPPLPGPALHGFIVPLIHPIHPRHVSSFLSRLALEGLQPVAGVPRGHLSLPYPQEDLAFPLQPGGAGPHCHGPMERRQRLNRGSSVLRMGHSQPGL